MFIRDQYILIGSIIVGLAIAFGPFRIVPQYSIAQTPPTISDITVSSTTDTSVTITWTTDEASDGTINYGKQSDYGIVRSPSFDDTEHELTIENLDPSTSYHFRITSADSDGNQGISGDFTFITTGFEDIEEIEKVALRENQALVGQAAAILEQLDDPNAIEIIQDAIKNRAEDVLRPPSIEGAARVAEIGMDYAVVVWKTNREAGSQVAYATAEEYAANGGTYARTQGIPDERTLEHEVRLEGLLPATTYHFQVQSEDDFDLEGLSDDNTFETKSRLPSIVDVQLLKIEETSVTIAWSTDIPAAGAVEYENLDTGELRAEGSPEFLTTHTVRLSDLTLGTTYVAVVKAENEEGDATLSEQIVFTTVEDEEPPIISKVTNDSTLFPGAETRIQTIVKWDTDEPSTCEMFFRQGIQETVEPFGLGMKDEPTSEHVQVVVEFQPATVYQFWVECTDLADNTARSENFVLFTPAKEKSIIDIILENFEGAFGWVKNIGG